jgi:type IV secretion system protein VirB4
MISLDPALRHTQPRRAKIAKREVPESEHIPYACHYDAETLLTKQGDLAQIIQVVGLPFETADDELLVLRKNLRNALLRSVADSRFAVYVHTIRRKLSVYPGGELPIGFAAEVDGRWREKHSSTSMLVNELFITLLRKAPAGSVRGAKSWMDRLSHRADSTEHQVALRLAHKELKAISQRLLASLQEYRPRVLGLIHENGWPYSEPGRFLGRLINLEDRPVLLPTTDLSKYLPWRRIYFGRDALEVTAAPCSLPKLASIVSIKEYGPETYAGLLDRFLQIPRELIITQSFVFEDRQTSLSRMQMQQRRMVQTEDLAASQVGEIDQALDDAQSGYIAFGHHHLTVLCAEHSLPELDKAVADVESALVDIGIVSVREDLNLEPAFWAQLPGNFPYIARRALISTANFAGFASLHNYPCGKPSDNHWGPAVTLLETVSGTPYFFNWHRGEVGHTLLIGPTGAGKSVAMNFLLVQSVKFNPRIFYFDKDRGAEIFIRAMGGKYALLGGGHESGLNPLQLPDSPANRAFIERWLGSLVVAFGEPLKAVESAAIGYAVEGNYALPLPSRTLENVAPFLGLEGPSTLGGRLSAWYGNGNRSKIFGGSEDRLHLNGRILGFEMGEILDDPVALGPVLLYLFHRIELQLDGTPTILVLEEGWKLLDTPNFAPQIKDWLQTLRKLNAIVVFVTPNIEGAVECSIGDTLVQQAATSIFLPNYKASKKHYCDAFKLSEREYQVIRNLAPESRTCLIKHGSDSIVAKLDLSGLEDLIPVLSGTAENVRLLQAILSEHGEEPDVWLPIFRKRVKDAKSCPVAG